MAANEIKLTLKVNDDNSLSIVGKKAKDAAAGVDKLDQSSKNLNKTQGKTYRNMQGVAGTSSNLTKNFSKMQQGIGGGLVPAYAALAARIFAITALFNVLQRAAAVSQLEQGLIAVGNAAGQNLPYVADRLREISGLAVSTQQAMQATALATSAGFSTTQLEQLTKVAKGASLALGRDMGDALDRLVRGTAKLEPEILDELGIMVRLDDAVREYAVGLQKSADSLTQFERRQAFLNATLEQGTKKFDNIANVVEVNPYDKLAATFDDLSKTIINFGNKALIPIVEYLSNAPGALIGILALMGKTITNELTPALGELSSRAAENAEAFAAHAESLKKQTVKDYRKIAKTINSLDFAPDSLKNAAGAYKEGSRGIKEMQKDLTALKISETSRATALTKYRADNAKYSAEFIAQKEVEEQKVKDLRIELERLIAVEQGRGGVPVVSAAATNAGVQASQEGIVAAGIGNMTGSISNDFKEAASGTKNLGKEVKNATGFFGKLGAAGNAAGGSMRLFGAALGSVLGPLGMIITAVGLLAPLLSKFFEKTAQEKAMQEIGESFESFTTIAIRLNKVVREEGVASFNAYYAAMKAGSGVLSQIQAGIAKAIEASNSELQDQLRGLSDDLGTAYGNLISAEEKLQEAQRNNVAPQSQSYLMLAGSVEFAKMRIQQLEDQTKSLSEQMGEFTDESRAAAKTVIELALGRLRATGMDAFLEEEVTTLEKLSQAVSRGDITIEEFNKELEKTTARTSSFTAGVDAAAQASSNLSKEMLKLGDKPVTAFSRVRDEAKAIADELAETGAKGEQGFLKIKNQEAQYKRIRKAILANGGALRLSLAEIDGMVEGTTKVETAFRVYSEMVAENEGKMITANSLAKKAAETAKQMAKFSKDNAFFKEQELTFERQTLTHKKAALVAERKNYNSVEKTPDVKAKIKALNADILAIEAQIADKSEDTFQIEIARIQGLQRMNKALSKQSALMISLQGAQQDLARRRIEMSNADLGIAGLTAQDEADILKASAETQKKEEEKAFRLKLEAINLEHELLKQQFALEELKMHNLLDRMVAEKQIDPTDAAKQKSAISTTISALSVSADANRNLQMQIAAAKFGIELNPDDITFSKTTGKIKPNAGLDALIAGAITGGDLKNKNAELAAQEKERLETIKKLNTEASTARQAGNEALAISKEQTALTKEGEVLQARLTLMKTTELAKTETQEARNQKIAMINNQIADNEQKQIEKRIAARELEVETATRLGGPLAGAFMSLVTGIQDVSEKGGVLADGSTASFGEKVAAIKEKSGALIEQLSQMGPDGPVIGATINAAFTMGEAFSNVFDTMKDESATTSDKIGAGIQAVSAVIQSMGAIQQAKSQRAIAAIDAEIAAEKKRDGKSTQSLQKIKKLEAKKLQMEKKAFEQQKKMQMASVIASTAMAIVKTFQDKGYPAGVPFAAAMAAIGAAQLAVIASTSFQGGGSAPSAGGGTPSKISMGQRSNVVDVSQRASGGELAYLRGQRGSGSNANDFTPAFYGSKKMRAAGGAVAGYTVGEQGPELFVPETPGRIVPNDDITQGAPVNVTFNVQAIDASTFNDALTTQRGNIISMIREAANSSGEGFLETVDTNALQMER